MRKIYIDDTDKVNIMLAKIRPYVTQESMSNFNSFVEYLNDCFQLSEKLNTDFTWGRSKSIQTIFHERLDRIRQVANIEWWHRYYWLERLIDEKIGNHKVGDVEIIFNRPPITAAQGL